MYLWWNHLSSVFWFFLFQKRTLRQVQGAKTESQASEANPLIRPRLVDSTMNCLKMPFSYIHMYCWYCVLHRIRLPLWIAHHMPWIIETGQLFAHAWNAISVTIDRADEVPTSDIVDSFTYNCLTVLWGRDSRYINILFKKCVVLIHFSTVSPIPGPTPSPTPGSSSYLLEYAAEFTIQATTLNEVHDMQTIFNVLVICCVFTVVDKYRTSVQRNCCQWSYHLLQCILGRLQPLRVSCTGPACFHCVENLFYFIHF